MRAEDSLVDKAQHGSMDVVRYDYGMATSIPLCQTYKPPIAHDMFLNLKRLAELPISIPYSCAGKLL